MIGQHKDYLKHTHTIKTVEITVKDGGYASLFLFSNIARGSNGHLQEIYWRTFFGNHVRR